MPSHRMDRNTEDIKREISAILRELNDPRVNSGLISVVRVDVTNDLSYCKVYVSAMDGIDTAKTAALALKNAAGYIRKELGSRLHIRHVPSLIFTATDSIEYGASISKLLNNLKDDTNGHHSE